MDFNQSNTYEQKKNDARDKVRNQYLWNGGTCVALDKLVKDVRDRLVLERSKTNQDSFYIKELADQKAMLEIDFASNACSDKIETLRQNESAVLITKQAIEQEKSVLKSSNTDQRIYIGVGALVLLVGLIILVKK
jgi:hypothetical protein